MQENYFTQGDHETQIVNLYTKNKSQRSPVQLNLRCKHVGFESN
jgi:hypothetical protein